MNPKPQRQTTHKSEKRTAGQSRIDAFYESLGRALDLARDLRANDLTLSEIADKHDLGAFELYHIVIGRSRPSVKALLTMSARMIEVSLRRRAAQLLPDLFERHVTVATTGAGPEAAQCREFLINLALGQPLDPPPAQPPKPPAGKPRRAKPRAGRKA